MFTADYGKNILFLFVEHDIDTVINHQIMNWKKFFKIVFNVCYISFLMSECFCVFYVMGERENNSSKIMS